MVGRGVGLKWKEKGDVAEMISRTETTTEGGEGETVREAGRGDKGRGIGGGR